MEEFDDERLALRLSPPIPRPRPPPLPPPQPPPAQQPLLMPMSVRPPQQYYQLLQPQQQLVRPTVAPPHPLLMLPTYDHGNMHEDEQPQLPQYPLISQRARRLPAHDRIKEEEDLEAPFAWATNKHEFDLLRKFVPEDFMNPELLTCSNCKEPNNMKPVIPNNKHEINWLFLFLVEGINDVYVGGDADDGDRKIGVAEEGREVGGDIEGGGEEERWL
ncbi:hypothetical protein Sjap_016877 [Stephania japonica]|uniref:DUF7086 domain-containing protein n=1 Tax=Stephania japonica TaxID=461633 RepID=A0AAP0NHS2_9MAGN